MKTPLPYQLSHFDCGTASMLGALVYLFERDELPLATVRHVVAETCDLGGDPSGGARVGTSAEAMDRLAAWLADQEHGAGLPLRCERVHGDDVTLRRGGLLDCALSAGSVVVAGVCLGSDHYVLLTGIEADGAGDDRAADDGRGDRDLVRVFDPYYDTWPLHELDVPVVGVRPVDDRPFSHNRLVERRVFDMPKGTPYSFAQKIVREATILTRI